MAVVLDASALLAYLREQPFLPVDGDRAGRLWPLTRQLGLSLADRACLSLEIQLLR